MTEIDLQIAIKDILEREIIPNISLFENEKVKCFLQDLPLSSEFDNEDDKYFPCLIVAYRADEIKTASDAQETEIEIIVAIKDFSEDLTGYQKLLVVLQHIRDYFTANAGIDGKFRLLYPIKRSINEDTIPGYFVGHIVTKWVADIMPYKDIHRLL